MRDPARQKKREQVFNSMMISIMGNWDVVEDGLHEENEWEKAENNK